MLFMSSWVTDDKRILLHFSTATLETFCQHVQGADADYEAGGLLLGSVHGVHMSLNKRQFPRRATNGFATCSSGCRLGTKPSPCLDGRRVREPSAIWANGIPTRKTVLGPLVSIGWNGGVYQQSARTRGQCLLLSSGEKTYMLS